MLQCSVAKKSILDNTKALDAVREGKIGRDFEDALRVWLLDNKVEHVAIEAPVPSNKSRRETHINPEADFAGTSITYTEKDGTSLASIFRIYGLEMMACAVCARLNIPAVFVVQSSWRKAFLGNGSPMKAAKAKQEAVKQCRRYGIEVASVDAAEAVGIAYWLNITLFPYSPAANSLFNLPPTMKSSALTG